MGKSEMDGVTFTRRWNRDHHSVDREPAAADEEAEVPPAEPLSRAEVREKLLLDRKKVKGDKK